MTHTRLRPWAMAGMLNENAALRLGLAEKLAGMLDPGHLALTLMAEKLIALRQQTHPRTLQSPGLTQQYADPCLILPNAQPERKGADPARANGAGR